LAPRLRILRSDLKAPNSQVDTEGMAETLLLVSKALFAAAGCGAGLRLAQLARGTGGVPLHAFASAMIFVGGIGLLGFGLGPSLAAESPALARWVMLISDALERVAMLMLALFVWRVFGFGSRSRAVLLSAALVAMTASWTYVLLFQRWPEPMLDPAVQATSQLAFAAPYVWAAAESWLERRRTRRQLALGLTDAVTANRFLLWALGCGAFACSCFAAALAVFLPDGGGLDQALGALRAALYTATAALVVLAFFPPGGYLRWVAGEARDASPEPAARAGRASRALLGETGERAESLGRVASLAGLLPDRA
jgi:hypothetical protein